MDDYKLMIRDLADRFILVDHLIELIKQQDDYIESIVKYLIDHYNVMRSDISFDIQKVKKECIKERFKADL